MSLMHNGSGYTGPIDQSVEFSVSESKYLRRRVGVARLWRLHAQQVPDAVRV